MFEDEDVDRQRRANGSPHAGRELTDKLCIECMVYTYIVFICVHCFSALKWWAFLDRHDFMSLVSFYSRSIFWSDRSAAFGCRSFGWALSIGRRMDIYVCVCVCVLSARLPEGQIHQYSATCSMILKTCHRDHDRREVRPLKEHHTAGKKESHKTEHGNSLFVASFISRSFSHLARPTRAAGFAYNRSHWTNIDSWARMI